MKIPILAFTCVLVLAIVNGTQKRQDRLIIFLIDGVRWDYVDRDSSLKGFQQIAREGVTVKQVTPVFPSLSYPNWYTIATGLYTESHGIIENKMYDPVRQDQFLMGPHPNVSHEHWWNKAEPIWVRAEKNGIRASVNYWDGCQVKIQGVKPSECIPYQVFWIWLTSKWDTTKKMIELLKWFEESEDNRLAMVYYEGPDFAGHTYGPDAYLTKKAVRDADDIIHSFQEALDVSSVRDSVNLMVVSDHGMSDVHSSKVIALDDFDIKDDIELTLGDGALMSIFPLPGKVEKVYNILTEKNLKGLHVYRRQDIPEIYRMKNGDLTPPLLLVVDHGYYLTKTRIPIIGKPVWTKGTHGFDPYICQSDMNTLMYSKGPAFKKGYVGSPLQQTDHYNVFCHILGIAPQPNNGSWDRVKDLLVDTD